MSKKSRDNKQKNHQKKCRAKNLRRLKKKSLRSKPIVSKSSKHNNRAAFTENCIYRFFPEEWQAEALINGDVWISTLETCRGYENSSQGDPAEATMTYNSGSITGDGDNPDVQLIAQRTGISLGTGCTNITMSNNTNHTKLPDAYVLCTTDNFSPEKLSETFGKYCVKINNPKLFFERITECLKQHTKLKESLLGKVIYKDRFYQHTENPPGPIGFVKPRHQYSDQNEVRMLWILDNSTSLTPFKLSCNKIVELCERIA